MEQTNENVGSPAAPAESAPAPDQTTAPEAPASEATAPPAPPAEEKGPSRLQKRIDQITRERYDEQRRAEALEQELAQFKRQQAYSQQFSQLDAQAPQVERFQSLQEYQMAMANWTTQKAAMLAQAQWEERQQAERATQAQQFAQMAQQQQRIAAENAVLEQKMAAGTKKYADFTAAITNPELPQVRGTPLFGIILEAENAVDVAYALAKNPAELERLLSLPPERAAREVFRMDTKFAGNGPTSAPPPPPSRNGSSAVDKDPESMSQTEFNAWRRRSIAAKRG